jgi:hypothetical protein
MTTYEMNYKARLDEMLKMVWHKYGYETEQALYFATMHEKYYNTANYENRETMEKIFKGLMK